MSAYWSSGKLSILVIPDEKLYDSLVPIIKEWTTEGLMSPFMIICPADYESASNRAPKVEVSVFGLNDQKLVENLRRDLFTSLATQEWRMVRLIALHQITDEWNAGKCNWGMLDNIANHVANVLPLAGAGAGARSSGTYFRKMNLVVAKTHTHNDEVVKVLSENWDVNIFASPEDRSNPWSPDAMIEDENRLNLFSLVHAASVGALWEGIDDGPYDLIENEGGTTGKIFVSRSFVSAVVTDSLARRVAAKTLSTIGLAPEDLFSARLGVMVPGTQLVPPQDIAAYRQWMVEQIFSLDNGYLQFKQSGDLIEPPKLKWFELAQIVHFLKFSGQKLAAIPQWAYLAFRRKLGRGLTKTLHGEDGLAQVGVNQDDVLDRRDRLLLVTLERSKLEAQNARRAMSAPYSKRSEGKASSSASLWSGIRRIFFGLLDGSSLQDFGISEDNGPLPVFPGLSLVVQDPDDVLVLQGKTESDDKEITLDWTEVADAQAQIELLSARRQQLLDEQVALRNSITDSEKQLVEIGGGNEMQ
jgi:hypothetical protein